MSEDPSDQKPGDIPAIKSSPSPLLQEIGSFHHPWRKTEKPGSQGMDHGKMSGGLPRKDHRTVALEQTIASRRKEATGKALPFGTTLEGKMLWKERLKTAVDHGYFQISTQ